MSLAYGFEVRELVGELGDGSKVVLEAMEDDLSVGLVQLRDRGRIVQQTQQ